MSAAHLMEKGLGAFRFCFVLLLSRSSRLQAAAITYQSILILPAEGMRRQNLIVVVPFPIRKRKNRITKLHIAITGVSDWAADWKEGNGSDLLSKENQEHTLMPSLHDFSAFTTLCPMRWWQHPVCFAWEHSCGHILHHITSVTMLMCHQSLWTQLPKNCDIWSCGCRTFKFCDSSGNHGQALI